MVMTERPRIAELKARLSAYLAAVRGGASLVVCDRNTPIARITPYERDDGVAVRAPRRSLATLRTVKGVRPRRPVDVATLLRETRGDR